MREDGRSEPAEGRPRTVDVEVRVDDAAFDDPDLFRRFVETIPDGFWLVDADGRTIYANARLAELLGRTLEETRGLAVPDVLDEEGGRQWAAKLEEMRAGHPGEENVEVLVHRPDGTATWLLTSWAPFTDADGRLLGWLHRVTEHGEQHRLVERLRDKEEQLEAAQAIAHLGSWVWDPAHRARWPGPTSSAGSTASSPGRSRAPGRPGGTSSTRRTGSCSTPAPPPC